MMDSVILMYIDCTVVEMGGRLVDPACLLLLRYCSGLRFGVGLLASCALLVETKRTLAACARQSQRIEQMNAEYWLVLET